MKLRKYFSDPACKKFINHLKIHTYGIYVAMYSYLAKGLGGKSGMTEEPE